MVDNCPTCEHETQSLIDKIDKYASETGLSHSTICERATGNSRLYERLKRRIERDKSVTQRVERFIRKHPPAEQVVK